MRIYYFVPEDGDDAAHPNAFSIPDQTPTVAKIKKCFPLHPNAGEYFLFRFKYKIKHAVKFVWLDLNNESAQAPRISTTSIFMKVSRMTIESAKQNAANPPAATKTRPQKQKARSKQAPAAPASAKADADVNLFATAPEPSAQPEEDGFMFSPGSSRASDAGRLISFGFSGSNPSEPSASSFSFASPEKPEANSGMSLTDLDFSAPAAPAPAPSPSKKDDGMFASFNNFSM